MLEMLKGWKGQITVNDKVYENVQSVTELPKGTLHIVLGTDRPKQKIQSATDTQEYIFTVKAYMTKPASPDFDFMAKWNNNNPMPLRTMIGAIDKETRGMIHVKLRAKGMPIVTCMRCGKQLTNPISRHYGIGPECMSKLGFSFAIDDVDSIKEALTDIEWEGWIIRSAILSQEPLTDIE